MGENLIYVGVCMCVCGQAQKKFLTGKKSNLKSTRIDSDNEVATAILGRSKRFISLHYY